MDKLFRQMLARTIRVASNHNALRIEILRAVSSLTILSGFPPYNTLDNLQMGDLQFAIKIKQMYAPGVLDQARLILDSSQGLEHQDNCDPITPSFDYGQTKKAYLKRLDLMTFNLKGTQTGRFSTGHPNLPHLPSSDKDKL